MTKLTFCIPSKNNKRYLQAAIPSIVKNSYYKNDIAVFVDADNDGTVQWLQGLDKNWNVSYYINPNLNNDLFGIGKAYDFLINKSKTELVCVFHADMMLAKNADKYLIDQHEVKAVVCSTRIEPPLHPEGPEKIVKDFGLWPEVDIEEGFKEDEFLKFAESSRMSNIDKVTEGLFAPWLVSKTDFNAVGGHDYRFKSAREDSDLFNRFLLAGYKLKQSWQSYVYHLTARAGQFQHGVLTKDHSQKSGEWQELMEASTREYFRKWHSTVLHDALMKPIVHPVYDTTFVISKCTSQLLTLLEPWCDKMYIDCDVKDILDYIATEQSKTTTNLTDKILYNNANKYEGDVIVEFDGSQINTNNFQYIPLLSQIVSDSGKPNSNSKLDIFNVCINKKEDLKLTR